MIELYHHPVSPASQKVRLVLAEKCIDYEARYVDLPAKQNLDDWYLRLNPKGVLPTLVVDGAPICESSTICIYLDERYPRPPLAPDDPVDRARMRNWMKHVDEHLHYAAGALVWTLAMRPTMLEKSADERDALLGRIPDRDRRRRHRRWIERGIDSEDFPDAVATYRETIAGLETALAVSDWAAGARFTLADIALAPYFQAIDQFGWNGLLDGAPRVAAWFDRIRSRDSYAPSVVDGYDPGQLAWMKGTGAREWPKIASVPS